MAEVYNYKTFKTFAYAEENKAAFERYRNRALIALSRAGSVRMKEMIDPFPDEADPGSLWERMAFIDRLCDDGEFEEVRLKKDAAGTIDRIFISKRKLKK